MSDFLEFILILFVLLGWLGGIFYLIDILPKLFNKGKEYKE